MTGSNEGIAQPCPICGHHTLFYPSADNYPVHMYLEGRGVGCCNPACSTNSGEDDEDYDDD